MTRLRIGFSALLFGFATLALPALADTADSASAPDVARVSLLRGAVEIKRADSGDTVLATINAPVNVGDYLATHDEARAEVQFGFATAIRVAGRTNLRFVALEPERRRVQLASGTIEMALARGTRAHAEIETPRATVRPAESGRYRIAVAPDGSTTVTVRSGRVDVVTDNGTRSVDAGAALAIGGGAGELAIRTVVAESGDDFDRFNDDRDRTIARANSEAYVDDEMVGTDDLGTYGRWIENPRYGRVWSPYETAGWAPYHDGRFVWEPYYGWTWVAAEPWGWAPYHYGNWFYAAGSGWCWYPGAYAFDRLFVYRPAIVAFFSFGGGGTSFGFGNIGWVPLAPYEPFAPWYGYGRGYGNTTIVNNTVVNNTTNVTYVNPAPPTTGNVYTIYHNSAAPGGAVALDRRSFALGNFTKIASVAPTTLVRSTMLRGGILPVVPTAGSLRFAPRSEIATGIVRRSPRVDVGFAHFAPPQSRPASFAVEQAAIRAETATLRVAPETHPRPVQIIDGANDAATGNRYRVVSPRFVPNVAPNVMRGATTSTKGDAGIAVPPHTMQRLEYPRPPEIVRPATAGSYVGRDATLSPVDTRPLTSAPTVRTIHANPPNEGLRVRAPIAHPIHTSPTDARVQRATPVTTHDVTHP